MISQQQRAFLVPGLYSEAYLGYRLIKPCLSSIIILWTPLRHIMVSKVGNVHATLQNLGWFAYLHMLMLVCA